MKYGQETLDLIKFLHEDGFSSREIAKALGISKSGVNNVLKKDKDKLNELLSKGAKILIFDLETAADTALAFDRFNVNLSLDHIVKHGGFILCASWHWLGTDKIDSVWLEPDEIEDGDDSYICELFYELYEQADAVVAYNSKRFDQKVLQTRCIQKGMILPKVKVLDAYIQAKKYLKLPSNKLDAVAEFFGLGRKVSTGGITLWKEVQSGDTEAMKRMVHYCVHDVELLRDVYLRLRALGNGGDSINQALYYDDNELRCPVCGSDDIERTGRYVYTSLGKFHELECNDCGHRSRERTTVISKEKRESLLATPV